MLLRTPTHPRRGEGPPACVLGDLSLVRALGRSGVPVTVATSDWGGPVARSRYCTEILPIASVVEHPTKVVSRLLDYANTCNTRPVLFYQGDHDLLMISRWRDLLRERFLFVLPESSLVEDLVDKLRFARLAVDRMLPVPATRVVTHQDAAETHIGDWSSFPCVLKPATRARWSDSALVAHASKTPAKALRIESPAHMLRILPILASHQTDFVLQEEILGGEDRILSYHAYRRGDGTTAAEFTGRKLRTSPREYGFSTYIEVTNDAEVCRIGRRVLDAIAFTGVAKLDFKRDRRDGRIYLLEINPRFNLWHHPAALAGVNIPKIVYDDLLGTPTATRLPVQPRARIRWMAARNDFRALEEHRTRGELSLTEWLGEVLTADINEDFAMNDPLPAITALWKAVARRVVRRPL